MAYNQPGEGHGFTACGKTLAIDSFERARLQPRRQAAKFDLVPAGSDAPTQQGSRAHSPTKAQL
jgi:hypothetical protein